MNRLDDFIDQLQEEIFDEARQALGEKGFDRWRNPRFQGKMENPDGWSHVTGSCGDTMEIYLKFKNGRVHKASYFTTGCASSQICGSFAAQLTFGKKPEQVADITAEDVQNAVGQLPEEDRHCTTLAAGALQEALNNYMSGSAGQGC